MSKGEETVSLREAVLRLQGLILRQGIYPEVDAWRASEVLGIIFGMSKERAMDFIVGVEK